MGSTCKDLSLLLETASEIGSLLSTLDLNSFFLALDIKLQSLPSFISCDDSTKQAVRFATEQVYHLLKNIFQMTLLWAQLLGDTTNNNNQPIKVPYFPLFYFIFLFVYFVHLLSFSRNCVVVFFFL